MPNPNQGRRLLSAALRRSRAELVPPAFQFLWDQKRFVVAYGGRASAKSWSVARMLLIRGTERKHLILCARESQSSIKESAYRLLCDQVRALDLENFYTISADKLTGRNGSEIIFEGLFRNAERLKSYEGVTIAWVEEAHRVSERSWEDLIPTIRKPGSQIYITFNPSQQDDPVWQRFVASMRPDAVARRVSWRDNPFLSSETIAEKDWCAATDIDQFQYVWEGEFRTVTEAQILRGKYVSQTFDVDPSWSGPYFGLDFGFSQDPTAGTVCYIDDTQRVLYVAREFWKLGCDIDALPGALERALPGAGRNTVYCDSARPESISYIARNGVPGARSAEKWPGSIDDGVSYLRSFAKIVIHTDCTHTLDEANRYSYKVDRLTGNPLPEVEDKHNHNIDSIRYALSPLIRNKAAGGSYFSRSSLLVNGEPVALPLTDGRTGNVAVLAAITEQPGSALALVYITFNNKIGWPLLILDWQLVEFSDLSESLLIDAFNHAQELRELTRASSLATPLLAEGALFNAIKTVGSQLVTPRTPWNIAQLDAKELPATLDERAAAARELVNLGLSVKLAYPAYARQSVFRAVSGNHLTTQLFGYKPGIRDADQSLIAAFILACCGCLLDAPRQRNAEAVPRPLVTSTTQVAEQHARRVMIFEQQLAEWQRDYDIELARQRVIGRNPNWTPDGGVLRGFRPRPMHPNVLFHL